MKKTIKIVLLLVLGAVLGQVLLVGVGVLHFIHKIKGPNFFLQTTMLGTAPDAMSNDELGFWNNMRDNITHGEFADVNRLIQIRGDELDFEVIPAKPVFALGESVLAEIRIKNISNHTLHVNEPREMKLTLETYFYLGLNQLDYDKVNYSLSIFEFNQQKDDKSTEFMPVVKRATCNFAIK